MSRFGDWNAKNRELLSETQRLGRNSYYRMYLEAAMPAKDVKEDFAQPKRPREWKAEFALLFGKALDELQQGGALHVGSGRKASAVLLAFIEQVRVQGQVEVLEQLIEELSPVSKLLSSAYALERLEETKKELKIKSELS
jgi:hypothetical protein